MSSGENSQSFKSNTIIFNSNLNEKASYVHTIDLSKVSHKTVFVDLNGCAYNSVNDTVNDTVS